MTSAGTGARPHRSSTEGPVLRTELGRATKGAHQVAAGCVNGAWASCTPARYVSTYGPEVCDGLDNDCDGLVDADDPDLAPVLCEKQLGVCAGATHLRSDCSAGRWSPCAKERYGISFQPTESACDGLDNNCDGQVDEGCVTPRDPPPPPPPPWAEPTACGCAGGPIGAAPLLAGLLLWLTRRPRVVPRQ